jgi:hypothetical protein
LEGVAGVDEAGVDELLDDELLESDFEDVLSLLFESPFDSFESLFDSFESLFDSFASFFEVGPLSPPDCFPFCA